MVNQPDDPNQAQAWISGTPPDQTIDFYIPRGNTGPMGPRGPIGPSLAVGSVETVTGPAAPGTVGPTGLTGPKGDPGGFAAATDLGASDLNNILTAGLYRVTQGANVTLALNYPITMNATAVMQVYMVSSTNVIQQFEILLSTPAARGFWQRSTSTGGTTWTAWRFFASQRIDQAAGRAIYTWDDLNNREQLVYGDTGWRDLTSLVTNGWTASMVSVRRVGSQVFLRLYQANGAASTSNTILTVPSGFLPGVFQYNLAYTEGLNMSTILIESTGNIRATGANTKYGTSAYSETSWSTTNSWPTTLPGTASGSIPT